MVADKQVLPNALFHALLRRCFHDMASPLNNISMAVEQIEDYAAEAINIIAQSSNALSQKFSIWRYLMNPDHGDNNSTIAQAFIGYASIKKVTLKIDNNADNDLVAKLGWIIILMVIEGLPRGGDVTMDWLHCKIVIKGRLFLPAAALEVLALSHQCNTNRDENLEVNLPEISTVNSLALYALHLATKLKHEIIIDANRELNIATISFYSF